MHAIATFRMRMQWSMGAWSYEGTDRSVTWNMQMAKAGYAHGPIFGNSGVYREYDIGVFAGRHHNDTSR